MGLFDYIFNQRKKSKDPKLKEYSELQKKQKEDRKQQGLLEFKKLKVNSKNNDIKNQNINVDHYSNTNKSSNNHDNSIDDSQHDNIARDIYNAITTSRTDTEEKIKDINRQHLKINSPKKNNKSSYDEICHLALSEEKIQNVINDPLITRKIIKGEYRNEARIKSWELLVLQCRKSTKLKMLVGTSFYKTLMDDIIRSERILKGYELNGYITYENADRMLRIIPRLVETLLAGEDEIHKDKQELQRRQDLRSELLELKQEEKRLDFDLNNKSDDKHIISNNLNLYIKNNEFDNNKLKIKEILARRKINKLLHFTRLDNLSSILKHGLVPVSLQQKRGISAKRNDWDRYDTQLDCTSFSIEFPNYRLFFAFRNKYPDTKWAVIMIHSDVLLLQENTAYYCHTNASSVIPQAVKKSELCGASYFENMFCEMLETKENKLIKRSELMIKDNYTTDPQAEILISNVIAPLNIRYIYFYEESDVAEYISNNGMLSGYAYKVDPYYFKYRNDYMFWQKES